MAKCHQCRNKDVELLTVWERVRFWLFNRLNHTLFPQDFDDLKSEKYTQGFSDGNLQGFEQGKNRRDLDIARYGI